MFDPEKVSRIDHTDTIPGEYVRASDYDALLGRYVAAMRIVGAVGMEIITLDIPKTASAPYLSAGAKERTLG